MNHYSAAVISLAMSAAPAAAGASTFTTLYSFAGDADGAAPANGLISDGTLLYGATPNVAINGINCNTHQECGTLFSFDTATGTKVNLASFKDNGPNSPILLLNGTIYGEANPTPQAQHGRVWSVTLATLQMNDVYDFGGSVDAANAYNGLIDVGGNLVGTSSAGGNNDLGTVFTVDPANGTETVNYTFQGKSNGENPAAAPTLVGTILYGTTFAGGSHGTIYQIDTTTGAETTLHAFKGNKAEGPSAAMIYANDVLYGTTLSGGGALFQFDASSGTFTALHEFGKGKDGAGPEAPLTLAGTVLYGTTNSGGTGACGTIFKFDLSTGKESVLYSFTGKADGGDPNGSGLTLVNGTFYGTTAVGGAHKQGTIFSFTP